MKCSVFNVGCHIQSSIWEWWSSIGFLNKSLIVLGLMAVIVGVSWGFLRVIKAVGGWPAVIGAVAVILGIVLAIMPRKPKGDDSVTDIEGPDAEGPFQFGKDRVKKPKRPKAKTDDPDRPGTWNPRTGSWNE